MTGFAGEDGSSNAEIPAARINGASRTPPSSTATSITPIPMRGSSRFVSMVLPETGNLITGPSSSKSMDLRDALPEFVLTIILVISTLVLVLRLWQDITIAVSATLMMLSLGGLFLIFGAKITVLSRTLVDRERGIRLNLIETQEVLAAKYDETVAQIDAIIQDFQRRLYR